MTYKMFSYGEQLKAINGKIIDDKKYNLKVNPDNKNNVFLSLNDNGKIYNKFDNLENFFKGMKYENFVAVDNNPFTQTLKSYVDNIKQIKTKSFTKKNRKRNNSTYKKKKKKQSLKK